jgi:hypothetical protein
MYKRYNTLVYIIMINRPKYVQDRLKFDNTTEFIMPHLNKFNFGELSLLSTDNLL